MSWRGLPKRERSPSSAISVAALTKAMPRIVRSAATTGANVQSGSRRRVLCCQPIAPHRGGLDRGKVILEHEMVHRLFKPQPCKPAAVQLGPCRAPIMASLA
jgi:hypothetical protein